MNEREHEQLRESLGAFALDAMDPIEMRRIEHHLRSCATCSTEVQSLRETSAELAWLPATEDADELVERISSSLPHRPRRIVTRIAVGVAAVSVSAAGFLGTALVRERARNHDFVGIVATADRRVALSPQNGFDGRGTVYVAHGRAALLLDGMPDPGAGRAYQLWAISGTQPASMTVVSGRGRLEHAFAWNGRAERFAVTIEPTGGSPVPTSDPVLAGV